MPTLGFLPAELVQQDQQQDSQRACTCHGSSASLKQTLSRSLRTTQHPAALRAQPMRPPKARVASSLANGMYERQYLHHTQDQLIHQRLRNSGKKQCSSPDKRAKLQNHEYDCQDQAVQLHSRLVSVSEAEQVCDGIACAP